MDFEMDSVSVAFPVNVKRKSRSKKKAPVKLKLTLVGDQGVGKSGLVLTFLHNRFPGSTTSTSIATAAAEFETTLSLDSKLYDLKILDTRGSTDFDRYRPLAYEDTDCFILCYAVNSKSSYTNIRKRWLPQLIANCPKVPIVVVATKCDLSEYGEPLLDSEIEKAWISIRSFLKSSAKNGQGLEAVIVEAIQAALETKKPFKANQCCSQF